MTPLNIFFTVLSIAAFLFEGFALVDALRRAFGWSRICTDAHQSVALLI